MTYRAQSQVTAGRPPCAECGAAFRLHLAGGACPVAYRPDTLEVARRELAAAESSGDQARIFIARGEVQRLIGRRPDDDHAATDAR